MDLSRQDRVDRSHTEWTDAQTMFFRKRSPLDMPLNLGDWFAPATLAEWVREEINRLDPTESYIKEAFEKPPECRPRLILALLALAYCTQLFRSEEIVSACHSDPVFRNLCGARPPFKEELEHFRRTHRRVVDNVVAQVLLRTVRERFHFGGDKLPPGLERNLQFRAEERSDIARHMSRED